MKNKKGISAIVATVLIILITVAAVTIIWAAIIPMISNQLDRGTICLDAVSQVQLKDEGYTCYSATEGVCNVTTGGCGGSASECGNATCLGEWGYNVTFQIGRGAKDFELADIQVLISVAGDTKSTNLVEDEVISGVSKLPGANGAEVYTISGVGFNESTQIQIAPIVKVGNTQEACDVSATKTLSKC